MIHAIIENHIQKITLGLAGLLVVLFGMYMYFVNAAVLAVVERQEIEEQVRDLRATVSELEFAYINSKSAVTLGYAEAQGFVASADTTFISRRHMNIVLDF